MPQGNHLETGRDCARKKKDCCFVQNQDPERKQRAPLQRDKESISQYRDLLKGQTGAGNRHLPPTQLGAAKQKRRGRSATLVGHWMLLGLSKHEDPSSAAAQTLLLRVRKDLSPFNFIPLHSRCPPTPKSCLPAPSSLNSPGIHTHNKYRANQLL